MDAEGRAYAGSQLQLQLYVERHREDIDGAITAATSIEREALNWYSPIRANENEKGGYKEYKDGAFLRQLGLSALKHELREFWPSGGPRWDGLARAAHSNVTLLIEAKNYPDEMRGGGCKATDSVRRKDGTFHVTNSRKKIVAALNATAHRLGVSDSRHWTGLLYQYANRLAHTLFLRDHGIDARLVNVCFHDDPHRGRSTSPEEWRRAWKASKQELGFNGNTPEWTVDLLLPYRDVARFLGPRTGQEDVEWPTRPS